MHGSDTLQTGAEETSTKYQDSHVLFFDIEALVLEFLKGILRKLTINLKYFSKNGKVLLKLVADFYKYLLLSEPGQF